MERDEVAHLAAQDVGVDGFDQVVDGTELVGASHGVVIPRAGDEDHRSRPFELPAQAFDGLEAVDVRHPYVDQQQSKLAPREEVDGAQAGRGFDDLMTQRFQHRAISEQVSR